MRNFIYAKPHIMKTILLAFFTCFISIIAVAQPPAGNADPGDHYGVKVKPKGALNLTDVAAKLEAGDEFPEVKIKAKVKDVCANKGCWLKLELPDGKEATVNMKDYGFFVPVAAKGKSVVIDGQAIMKVIPVSELRHYAEDAKKSKAEIEAIKEAKKEVKIVARGIVVVE